MRKYSKELWDRLVALKQQIVNSHKPCEGSGYVVVGGVDRSCICMHVFRYVKELVYARIPVAYWTLDWREFEIGASYVSSLQKYFEHFDNAVKQALGFLYLGRNGVGKTAMMCEIGKHAIINGHAVKYFTAQQYVTAMMTRKCERVVEFESAQIVLLDEIDKAYMKEGSDFVVKTVEEFLRRSMSEGKIVIAASNSTEEELLAMFGESTVSMIKRHLKLVIVKGKDRSDKLQDSWDDSLKMTYDYFHPSIVKRAKEKAKRESF